MANVTFYQSYNMLNPTMLYGDRFLVTSTKFSVGDSAGNSASYLGSNLSYSGYSVTGGTVTGFESYKNHSILLTITNTSINAKALQIFVDSGDRKAIEELAATGNDSIIGSSFDDSLLGYSGNDFIKGGGGNDFIDGGSGIDIAVFTGAAMGYTFSLGARSTIADRTANRDGTDTLTNVERLQFSDTMLALDIGKDQTAGSGYMLYKAAFNRTPDAGGLGFWINKMDTGMSYNDVAKNFVGSAEFKTAFGGSNPTVNTLVTKLYNNVLARAPDAGGLTFWQNKLSIEGWSTADVLGYFSTSGENVANITPLIANGIQYQQFVG